MQQAQCNVREWQEGIGEGGCAALREVCEMREQVGASCEGRGAGSRWGLFIRTA